MSDNDNIVKFMSGLNKRMKRSGTQFMNPDVIEQRYGVDHVVPTGLPSVDLQLICLTDEDGYKEYGFPSGRIVEIVGSEEAGKSQILNHLLANGRKQGGMAFKISSERDFDISWDKVFFEKAGLDWQDDVVNINKAKTQAKAVSAYVGGTATTLEEMSLKYSNIMVQMREIYGDNYNPPPTVIALDSIAALMSNDELNRWNGVFEMNGKERTIKIKEDGTLEEVTYKIGGHHRTLWNFFKTLLEDTARYNALFVFSNQYRANMDQYAKGTGIMSKEKAAHNASIRYMATVRMQIDRSAKGKDIIVTKNNRKWVKFSTVQFKLRKLRGVGVNTSEVQYLHMSKNGGIDYLYSLIDSFIISGMAMQKGDNPINCKLIFDLACPICFECKDIITPYLVQWNNLSRHEIRDEMINLPPGIKVDVLAAFDLAVKQLGPILIGDDGKYFRGNNE